MDRRAFISSVGAGTAAALAGCTLGASGRDDGLVVGTYSAFTDAETSNPSEWVKDTFEEELGEELTYEAPDGGLDRYIEEKQEGNDIDVDLYLGVNTDELVTADEELDTHLFEADLDIDGQEDIQSGLEIDPQGRAIPFNTGYISLVYNGTEIEAPETFDDLLDEEYSGQLIAQDPGTSTTGRAFLLHTIYHYGEDDYLEYWEDLQDNDVQVLGSWDDAYNAWWGGEAPMVVSYSTDQVFAAQDDANLQQHQVGFLNDQAYANPEGMALFSDAQRPDLARDFMEFILRPDVQGEIAEQNITFPATENAEVSDLYNELAKVPEEPVTFTYEDLQGSLSEWIEDWERQFATN